MMLMTKVDDVNDDKVEGDALSPQADQRAMELEVWLCHS